MRVLAGAGIATDFKSNPANLVDMDYSFRGREADRQEGGKMNHGAAPAVRSSQRFAHDYYLIRRQVFTLLHTNMHAYDRDGELVLYTRMKGFRLKEDLRLYADESMQQELLKITTENVIDFSAAYQVYDSDKQETVGFLKRKGFKSMLRDEWVITDAADQEVGLICEDSLLKALVRRVVDVLAFVMPQRYHVEAGGATLVEYRQNFNPFVHKLEVGFTDPGKRLDRRLGLAAAVLLLAIEGRQG